MVAVRIVCDSTADLDREYLAAHDVRVVPLKVIFGEEVLEDGVSMGAAQFYARMRSSTLHPRTSQPTPAEFEHVFREVGAGGLPIVCTTISADLSGTYASATQARAALAGQDIRVIDSRSAAIGHQALVRQAVRVAEAGGDADDVEAVIAEVKAAIKLFFTVETLEYLRRGGRIGGARALLGSMLDIKPILELRQGVIEPVDRVRTFARAQERLVSAARTQAEAWGGAEVLVAGADQAAVVARMAEAVKSSPNTDVVTADVGPVIGCHAGPGAVGIAVYRRAEAA